MPLAVRFWSALHCIASHNYDFKLKIWLSGSYALALYDTIEIWNCTLHCQDDIMIQWKVTKSIETFPGGQVHSTDERHWFCYPCNIPLEYTGIKCLKLSPNKGYTYVIIQPSKFNHLSIRRVIGGLHAKWNYSLLLSLYSE